MAQALAPAAALVDCVVDERAPQCARGLHCGMTQAPSPREPRSQRALRAPRRARQVDALARADAVRAAHAAAVGGVDALVAPAGAVVPLGDAPQRVALLDDIPSGQLDLRPGRLAACVMQSPPGRPCARPWRRRRCGHARCASRARGAGALPLSAVFGSPAFWASGAFLGSAPSSARVLGGALGDLGLRLRLLRLARLGCLLLGKAALLGVLGFQLGQPLRLGRLLGLLLAPLLDAAALLPPRPPWLRLSAWPARPSCRLGLAGLVGLASAPWPPRFAASSALLGLGCGFLRACLSAFLASSAALASASSAPRSACLASSAFLASSAALGFGDPLRPASALLGLLGLLAPRRPCAWPPRPFWPRRAFLASATRLASSAFLALLGRSWLRRPSLPRLPCSLLRRAWPPRPPWRPPSSSPAPPSAPPRSS